uniref:Lysosome-associated membrane glycoprotein 5 n=1 Tax=Schistosoma japonicum TaxID=6182 RepID=C1L607_SCHJA|nr:hypothetical protein [Schistosoma japonicum]
MFPALLVLIIACSDSVLCYGTSSIISPATFRSSSNSSNISVLLQGYININLFYKKLSKPPIIISINSTNQEKFQASASFEKERELLNLSWAHNGSNITWCLLFQFSKFENSYSLNKISLYYELPDFPGSKRASNNQSIFSVSIGSHYSCQAEQDIWLDNYSPCPVSVNLTLSQLKVQAFKQGLEPEFHGLMVQCSLDYHLDKIVPTIIGISLAVMIILALIAFIITSRRNRIGNGNSGTGSGGYQQK